jgi:aminopeptidase
MPTILHKYADLLVNYCMEVQPGDKVFVSSTLLAEPLVREVYRAAYAAGASLVEYDLAFRERERIYMENAGEAALQEPPTLTRLAMEEFHCYLNIRAPYNLRETSGATPERAQRRSEALAPLNKAYFTRTADRRLKRNLCQYPTDAAAQEAGMGLGEYEQFVFGACKLFADDPQAAWLQVRAAQQRIVDHLNKCSSVRYLSDGRRHNIFYRGPDLDEFRRPDQHALRRGVHQSGRGRGERDGTFFLSLYLPGQRGGGRDALGKRRPH